MLSLLAGQGGGIVKKSCTAERLNYIMKTKDIRQVDILTLCQPYCEKYNVKMNRSDLSQYVAGKSEPNQDKLAILGMALNVNESWLMGFDVPMEKETGTYAITKDNNFTPEEVQLVETYRTLSEHGKMAVSTVLKAEEKWTNHVVNQTDNILMAAHNDKELTEEELRLMREDINDLQKR